MDEKQHHEKKNAFSHELGSRSSGTRKGSEKTPKHASFQAFRLDTATRSVLWAVSRAVAQDHLRVTEPPPRVMPASSSLTRKRAAVPASKLKKLGATKLSEVDAKSDPNARESCSGGSLAMRPPDRRGALADLPRVSHTFHDAGGAPEPTPAFEPGTPSPTVRHFARLFSAPSNGYCRYRVCSRRERAPVERARRSRERFRGFTSIDSVSYNADDIEATGRCITQHSRPRPGAGCRCAPARHFSRCRHETPEATEIFGPLDDADERAPHHRDRGTDREINTVSRSHPS